MSPFEGERYRDGPAAEATPVPEAWIAPSDEAALVARFHERLRLFALRRLRDRAAAEDVAQETLRRVFEACRAGRLENSAALPAFVFQTAQHICLQHFRSIKREGRALSRLGAEDPPQHEMHPLAALVGEERRVSVRAAIERLDPGDRQLLRILYYEGVEPAAVAEQLGLTPGALRVRKHRALVRLAAFLERDT